MPAATQLRQVTLLLGAQERHAVTLFKGQGRYSHCRLLQVSPYTILPRRQLKMTGDTCLKYHTPSLSNHLTIDIEDICNLRISGIMRSECDIVRCSSQSLARLSNLSQSAAILYLTPVVIPAGHAKSGANTDSDPFEPFGRYLNGYHRRIRHVPYLPSVGLTSTHEEFLKEADVVIIVTSQPSSQSPDESLAQQADFASSVMEALDDHKDAAQRTLPFLVQFGQDERRPDVALFDNVFRTEFYTPTTAKQMAHLLFKGHRE